MFKIERVIILIALINIFFTLGAGESYGEVLERVDAYRGFSSKGYAFNFRTVEDGETTVLKVYTKGSEKAVIKYIEPKDLRDQFILQTGRSYWLIESGMSAPIRLSPRTMLFGTASSGDITSTVFSEQYKVKSIESVEQDRLIKLQAISKKGATYENIELLVRGDNYRPISAKCFSRAGIQLKTVFYTEYNEIDGKQLLTHLEIRDDVNNKSSLIDMYGFEEIDLPARHYSRNYMKNLKPEIGR